MAPKVSGSQRQQELASRVLTLMLARGMFMSLSAPITLSMSSLASFFESQGEKDVRGELESAIAANPDIFSVTPVDGDQLVSTTREGRAPVSVRPGNKHSFASRFLTPMPKPERPATRPRPRQQPAEVDLLAEVAIEPEALEVPEAAVEVAPEPEPELVEEAVPAVTRTIVTQAITPTDVSEVDNLNLAQAIRERLGADPRVANFGEQWLMEDRVPRFSRGDLRRLRDYMQEKEQPLTDDDLVQDVLGVRMGSPDFDLMRFALNYRLANEHREFEFVGTANQRFWSTSGLPQIGTTRRKLNEIGADYRFLIDETSAKPAHRSRSSIDHTLTFYEFIHGLLPYDAQMQELLPAPVTPNQKSAVLTFECPQSFTTYLVELRFPTPNRGGFILGLDDFYTENLVPGAIISIERTDNDGHYRVEYLPEAARSGQLLELDERRAQRYVFRPTTYACGVEESQLLTEDRFGGFANEKPLDDKARRRPEAVVAAVFERIGDAREGNFSADFETLLAGVNVERPMSPTLLRSILDYDDTGAFSRDPDADDSYTYVPGSTP
ncbi:MAG: hypothetical protein IT338_02705 [Thermomicrobiales bacterium]|nr:hypothetical protein [Thermomicrobiales bacterium]